MGRHVVDAHDLTSRRHALLWLLLVEVTNTTCSWQTFCNSSANGLAYQIALCQRCQIQKVFLLVLSSVLVDVGENISSLWLFLSKA